jgi:hypothetical protein
VVVDRYGECFLRLFLPNYVLIENILDLLRRRDLGYRLGYLPLLVFRQDLVAKSYALIADLNGRSGNDLPDGILRFSAERAAKMFLLGHRLDGERGDAG